MRTTAMVKASTITRAASEWVERAICTVWVAAEGWADQWIDADEVDRNTVEERLLK